MPSYSYTANGKTITSPRELSKEELSNLFSKPLSADPQAQAKSMDLTARVAGGVRKAAGAKVEEFRRVKEQINQPAARAGAAQAMADVARVGGPIVGGAMGAPVIGGAVGDIAAQGIEKLGGIRDSFSPGEVATNAVLGKVAPGLEGGVMAGVAKGAVFGAGSTTINSLMTEGKLPTVGRLAIGTATSALLVGSGRKYLRAPIWEVSKADVAKETHAILTGEGISRDMLTGSLHEEAKELQQSLPNLSAGKTKLAMPKTFRTRGGQFGSTAKMLSAEDAPYALETERQMSFMVPGKIAGPDFPPSMSKLPVRKTYLSPQKAYFGRTQRDTGIPIYSEMFDPVEQSNVRRIDFNETRAGELREATKGLSRRQQEKYQAWLEHPDKGVANQILKLNSGDIIRTNQMQTSWQRMFKAYGLEDGGAPAGLTRADEYLTEHLPLLRQSYATLSAQNPDVTAAEVIEHAFPVGVPRSVEFFRGAFEDGTMGFGDINSLGIASRHLNYGSYQAFVKGDVDAARKRFAGQGANLPPGLKDSTNAYLNQIEGASDPTGRDLGIFVSQFAGRLGYKISPKEAKSVVDSLILSSQYSSTLGLRPGPLLRNTLQTWQTGFSELGRYWFVGEAMSRTKAGRQLASQLGLFGGQTSMVRDLASAAEGAPQTRLGKFAKGMSKFTEKTLASYSSVDERNRAIMGLGQWARAQRAIRKANGNVAKFIDYAWLDSGVFQPGERDVLQALAKKGDFNEAARRSAIGVADNTQWSYRAGNRPAITAGTAGRAATGFGTWSMFYANYLRRLHSPTEMGAHPGKQALRLARFFAANAAVAGTATALGSAAGVEDAWKRALAWNFLSPVAYSGGPVVEEGMNMTKAAGELFQGQVPPFTSEGRYQKAARKGLTTFVPGYGVAKDFQHLVDPDKGLGEAALRVSGVLPRTAP